MSFEVIHNTINEHIQKYGVSVMGVGAGPDDSEPQFAYSIGLTQTSNAPELLMFALSQKTMQTLINDVAKRIMDGAVYKDGDVITDVANLPLAVREITLERAEKYICQAINHYPARELKVLMLVWCDREGRSPWHSDFDPSMADRQPKLWEESH